jgi:hypothetical protein
MYISYFVFRISYSLLPDAIIAFIPYNIKMRSKVIALTVIIVALVSGAAIMGFLIGYRVSQQPEVAGIGTLDKNQISPVSTQEAVLSVTQSSESGQISESEQLVNSFYRWYINCLKQNSTCEYKDRLDLDYQQIMDKTRADSGFDRLLCAQNTPEFFRIDHSTIDAGGLESVYVVESFANSQIQLIAEVQKTSTGPKIVNVICPRP